MKQVIFILSFVFATFNLYAQIQTTAKIKFTVNNRSKNETYTVKEGDSVTIYGYKKKSDIHYIAFSTKDIADVSSFRSIFFDVDAKQLKKLPNALSPEIKSLIAEKNNEIISEQYKIRKLQALDGNVSFIYNQKTDFFKTQNTYGEIFKGYIYSAYARNLSAITSSNENLTVVNVSNFVPVDSLLYLNLSTKNLLIVITIIPTLVVVWLFTKQGKAKNNE